MCKLRCVKMLMLEITVSTYTLCKVEIEHSYNYCALFKYDNMNSLCDHAQVKVFHLKAMSVLYSNHLSFDKSIEAVLHVYKISKSSII